MGIYLKTCPDLNVLKRRLGRGDDAAGRGSMDAMSKFAHTVRGGRERVYGEQ